MPTGEENGHGESRLDRIERMMQLYVIENHEEHAEFRREHRALLSAQVLAVEGGVKIADTVMKTVDTLAKLGETVAKLGDSMAKLSDITAKNAEAIARNAEASARLDVKMLETTEKLAALIKIVDGVVRGQQG